MWHIAGSRGECRLNPLMITLNDSNNIQRLSYAPQEVAITNRRLVGYGESMETTQTVLYNLVWLQTQQGLLNQCPVKLSIGSPYRGGIISVGAYDYWALITAYGRKAPTGADFIYYIVEQKKWSNSVWLSKVDSLFITIGRSFITWLHMNRLHMVV